MSLVPGLGIAQGMALTLRRFFEPKVTVKYPEDRRDPPHKFRGRLQLLYDEWGTLKCETCFQCAQACPIECIDMGGIDTRGRYHVHWGAPETYGERREESALRRSGRPVPDPAYLPFAAVDIAAVDAILEDYDHDPAHMLDILEATQAAYGYLPVAALKRISQRTGAWYAMIYGTASYYAPPAVRAGRGDRPGRRRRRPPAGRGDLPRRARRALAGIAAPAAAGADLTDGRPPQDARRPGRRSCSSEPAPPTRPTSTRRPGPAPSRACAGPSATSGATATIATIAESGPARPRRRRLPGRATSGGLAAATEAPRRYVVVNGYGADPATGTDRYLLERDPFAVIEGAAIAAFAIGATEVVHRRPGRGHRGHRGARGGHRRRRGRRLHRLRRPRLGPRHRRSASGRSRAPTCWARRRSC